MSKGSRDKGANAEREVAKLLQAWWQPIDPECRFAKTPLSGGWSTPEARKGFRMSGDVTTTSTSFPFTVESKRREGWSPRNFVLGNPCPVWSWWRQSLGQALELKAEPMMWLRRNAEPGGHKPPWIVVVRAQLVVQLGLPAPDLSWNPFDMAVDIGGVLPAAYVHERWLAMPPQVFVGFDPAAWQAAA